jgi:cyclic lactone autoinducer peptide
VKKRILIILATFAAFIAVFIAQASAASACFWAAHDPELPEELR